MESYSVELWNGYASNGAVSKFSVNLLMNCIVSQNFLIFFPIIFQWQHEENSMVLQLTIFEASFALAILLTACELCQRIENAFAEIDDMIDQFDWYLFPIEIQRILPIIITMAQKPITIECFGSISCNRDAFKKVSSTNHLCF